ncbi:hypothetical protein BDV96DRAFT_595184 [Lophiotrema nucula]|uniref:MYND-type domain-containing protein n=1 Tax=Lophiotrema nucula TaxID=690887 RepID=A0A6A5ZR71_9PLEO|nr:hypothetical protein BDV96DRAFT_595184 [Lophiotrema nucula]
MSMAIPLSWDQPSLSGDRLQAYASLLRIQKDGQIYERLEAEYEPGDQHMISGYEDDDTNSIAVNDLSSFNEDRLKAAFQDRVAELVANVKGGHHVAATQIFDTPQGIKLVVAKNEGLDKRDPEFLQKLQDLLRDISRTQTGHDNGQRQALWAEMLHHSDARIREWIAEFQGIAAKFNQSCLGSSEDVIPVQLLRGNILVLLDASWKESKDKIVEMAHAIWNTWEEQDFIDVCNSRPDLARKVRLSIGFLGRLKIAFNVLLRAAERLSGFDELTICPLTWSKHSSRKRWKERNKSWTLSKTFQSLSLPFNDVSVKELCGPKWDKYKLAREFDKIQRQSPQIHAEIQLILYGAQQDLAEGTPTSYIGCSKRSCFLCWEFLKMYGAYRTRATHGKIYNLWVMPSVEGLPEQQAKLIARALQSVEHSVKMHLRTEKEKGLRLGKESTVGDSSIATRVEFHGSLRTMEQIMEHLSIQRQAAQIRGPNESTDDTSLLSQDPYEQRAFDLEVSNSSEDTDVQQGGECRWCENYTENRCPYCNKYWYCNATCAMGSVFHRFECAGRALTTADYLERAVLEDELPDDPQTLDDYGFSRCKTWNQKSHLLGLYGGLLKGDKLSSEEVDEWRRSGTLVENIVSKYMAIPERYRGSYFPWFLQHKYLLEDDFPVEDPIMAEMEFLAAAIENAAVFLKPEDQMKHFTQLEPVEKRDAFLFFAMARESTHPHPTDSSDLWYKFGFCTCREKHQERNLGGLYAKLVSGNKFHQDYERSLGIPMPKQLRVREATFDEFWHAYRDGSLISLMDKCNLSRDRQAFQNLESFLAVRPGSPRPLVWRLRHYLEFEEMRANIPEDVLTGAQAYGMSSELNPREKMEMTTFYKKLWSQYDLDPLEMEDARCRGRLVEYAQKRLPNLDPDVARLLEKLRPPLATVQRRSSGSAPPSSDSGSSVWQSATDMLWSLVGRR